MTPPKTYTYDPLDRLATAIGPWGSLAWNYDANGNRLSQTNGNQYTYAYQANRLTSVSNGHINYYQYDNDGNTIHDGGKDFVYNQNQRLIRAAENGRTLAEHTYNGNGQRVIKKTGPANTDSASNQNTVYHYDLNGKLIAETAGNGKMFAEYIYLNGRPLAMAIKQANNERIYYYHNDHLGTPQKMTGSSGTVVWAADYKPFGEATITVNTITNYLGFPGQYRDAETGLYQNGFRDYSPSRGGYIESDPLLQRFFFKRRNFFLIPVLARTPERLQPYSYVASNPVNLIDPLGLYHCVGGANCNFTPDMNTALQCFDTCTGRDNAITGGVGGRNTPNSSHARGEACDIGRNSNPDLTRPDAERCTTQCFPNGYGQEEQNGPNTPGTHFHIQLHTTGGQPGFGDGIRGYQP